MELQPEQKQTVAQWVASGDNLSTVQRKLMDQFKLSLTYMEVRFLVDDLNLELKDPQPPPAAKKEPAPEEDAQEPSRQEKKGFLDKMKEKVGLGSRADADGAGDPPAEDGDEDYEALLEDEAAGGAGSVTVSVDSVTLIPGAVASGSVTFSDGVTGKWIVDQYGRPGFTEISKPGYRPTQADAQAFMQELGRAIQSRGY